MSAAVHTRPDEYAQHGSPFWLPLASRDWQVGAQRRPHRGTATWLGRGVRLLRRLQEPLVRHRGSPDREADPRQGSGQDEGRGHATTARDRRRRAHRRGVADRQAFLEHWLTTVVAGRVGERTRDSYERIVRKHLSPALGHIRLEKLTPEDVDRMLAAKAATGLCRAYITRMRIVLADALEHAQRRGLVVRNAGALAVMPRTAAPTPRRPSTSRSCSGTSSGPRRAAGELVARQRHGTTLR
ncbi:hypothetical protein GHK86_17695 [Acidimicrobiaceae bacterium USS-CC1]|uniref:Core-binding (CB) domain-containing protein n=1 Tax=Acidiferrimicrobium australe TaxID=2664430 RepID=A0ABW9QXF9_9ACTN|nr:hypothetical protein [Acidiferrimicrobium australe]